VGRGDKLDMHLRIQAALSYDAFAVTDPAVRFIHAEILSPLL